MTVGPLKSIIAKADDAAEIYYLPAEDDKIFQELGFACLIADVDDDLYEARDCSLVPIPLGSVLLFPY